MTHRTIHRSAAIAVALAALAVPSIAQAHVTLNPKEAASRSFTELAVRVPNERDDAATTKVALKLPPGFVFASYEAQPGWTVKVDKTKLAKPVVTDDGPVDEQVSQITWTADSDRDGVQPGEFKDFPLSVQIPGTPGQTLTFKALQTYGNGEVVRWIGPESSETPAPTVKVIAAANDDDHAAMAGDKAASVEPPASDDFASKGLGIAALIVGGIGLLVGVVAIVLSRRRSS